MVKKSFLLIFIMIFSVSLTACKRSKPGVEDDDIHAAHYHDLAVRDAKGFEGMVASASSYASKVGMDVLKAGGNAFDAAAAVAFTLNVTEPNASGAGGGGFMVGYDAENDQKIAYNFSILAPGLATREYVIDQGNGYLSSQYGAIGVPRFIDGWLTILDELGTKDLETIIGPARDLARDGFYVPSELARIIADSFGILMRSRNESLNIYSNNGIFALNEGELLINENLANTFDIIIEEGKSGFYSGDIAQAIVDTVQAGGGLITMADMAYAMDSVSMETPRIGEYKDYQLISMPSPSAGEQAIIQFFNYLTAHNAMYEDIGSLEHNSSEYIHILATAMQMMFSDRRDYIADPRFADVPIEGLTSQAYANNRWAAHYNPSVGGVIPSITGNPWDYMDSQGLAYEAEDIKESASTTHFSVIDKWGNIASSTMTINYFFAEGIMAARTGLHLNNHMMAFSTSASSPNVVKPYKSPLSSMSPTIILKDGESFGTLGSPGSARILAAIVQTILNVIEFDLDIQTAIESPRAYQFIGSDLRVESGVGQETIDTLGTLGYVVEVYEGIQLYFGGVQGIFINQVTGELHGGADPRRDGKALGY